MQKISEFVGFVLKLYGKVSIFGPFLTLNAPKNPNFEFSWQIGLCQFSRLVVPYLHAKNQKICRRGYGWAAVTYTQTYRFIQNLDPPLRQNWENLELNE